ncbi:LysR family transcriptional regulator [Variovorax sp. LjRoot178]|uniref:LysR family transcriptional regulator n=1 Tax=Variovorax sp. LjRoot178 TaxID=3342277 RepID=UPI003ECEF827
MDKLRALQCLMSAAIEKSFSGAARTLGVSVPAVAKMVTALEKNLGVALFERTTRGLTLTASGEDYVRSCAPALALLDEADDQARASTARLRGTLVVGVQHTIARGCLTAALPRFHARHPDIGLDIRDFRRATEDDMSGLDIMLVLGWPNTPNCVQRPISAGRFIVAASPAYWAAKGTPERPKDLERHECLPIRAIDGTVMDLWTFTRGSEQESVTASGWLTTSNAHRDMVIDLAVAGHGVVRLLDWANLPELATGSLVRALSDWESPEAPPVNLIYRPGVRRLARARVFIEFVIELFRELEQVRGERVPGSERPPWLRRRYERSSASMARS